MRRADATCACLVVALVLGGCSSSKSSTPSRAAQAQTIMSASCFSYAAVMLSAAHNPKVPQLTQQQGAADMTNAANNAREAATLDPTWAAGAESLATLAGAMNSDETAVIKSTIPKVDSLCNPFIARAVTTTTGR